MIEADFKAFLKERGKSMGKYYTSGKIFGLNAVNDIIKWVKRVEKLYGIDLDTVVKGSEETKKLLRRIHLSNEVTDKVKRNFSGAVKAYFEFANGHEFSEE